MTFLTDSVSWGVDPVKPQKRKEDDAVKRTRQVGKFVSLEAAQNSKEWLSRRVPPSRAGAALYLTLFGYKATDGHRWAPTCAPWPHLEINVTIHAEINDHTWYLIRCSLSLDGAAEPMEWYTARRLCHLRQFWYDHVKREFGHEYQRHFADSPFAHHGAIVGTSARLNAWCKALTVCINREIASPYIAALTLKILDAPHLHALDNYLRAADVGIDNAMKHAIQNQVDSMKPETVDKENICPLSGTSVFLDRAAIEAVELFQIDVEFEDSELGMTMQDSKAFCIARIDAEEEEQEENEICQFVDSDAEQVAQYLQTLANSPPALVADEAIKSNGDDLSMPILAEGDMSSPSRVIDVHESQLVKLGFLPIIEEEKTDLTMIMSTAESLDDGASTCLTDFDTTRSALTQL